MPGGRLSRPAPENSALAERASKFINSYWEQSNASGDEALRYLSSIYAPVVNYYGQQRTRDSVLQDKRAFFRRWPIRQTWPAFEAGNPTISCDRARAECEITGLRDFAAESPKRGARSTGAVRYSYKVRFVDGTAQIVAESSKAIAAGANAVSSPTTLPPARGVAVAKGVVMPKPPAGTGHGAPRNAGNDAWRPPPAEARAAKPVIAMDWSDRKGRDRAGRVAAADHAGAAAAFASRPAVVGKADLAPAAEEASRQPREAHHNPRMAQGRAAQADRRGKPSGSNQPAQRSARAIAAAPAPLLQYGEDNRRRPRAEPAFRPMEARAVPALAQQNRTAMPPQAEGTGGGAPAPAAAGSAEYAPAAAAGWRQPAAWGNRGFAPEGRIEEAAGGAPEPAAGRAGYAPAAAAGWRRPAAWGNRDFAPQGRIEEAGGVFEPPAAGRAGYAPAAAAKWRQPAWGNRDASPDPTVPQGGTIIEGRPPPPFAPPPPPPRFRFGPGAGPPPDPGFREGGPGPFPDQGPGQVYSARWRPPFRNWGPPGPPPRFRFAPGAGPFADRAFSPARWRQPFRGWGPPGPPPAPLP
jgi:hypothetical protein